MGAAHSNRSILKQMAPPFTRMARVVNLAMAIIVEHGSNLCHAPEMPDLGEGSNSDDYPSPAGFRKPHIRLRPPANAGRARNSSYPLHVVGVATVLVSAMWWLPDYQGPLLALVGVYLIAISAVEIMLRFKRLPSRSSK